VPLLSITENIFLGNEPLRPGNLGGIIDWTRAHRLTGELLAKVGLKESPETLVTHLGVGKQQLVEIAKALSRQVRLLILDEPTASLNESDSQALLDLLLDFKAQGIASILISHKLNEISRVADAVTVLRDGSTVETFACVRDGRREAPDEESIIRSMVGRELTDRYPRRVPQIGEVVFELRNWVVHHPVHAERAVVRGVNLQARRGEIVGIAGLMGAGRTELAMSVFGRSYGQRIGGEVRLRGQVVDVSTVQRAIAHGLAYVTEDRKGLGLVLDDSILHNVSLVNLAGVSRHGVIDDGREHAVAGDFRRRLGIRCRDVLHKVVNLSGGNQQKVVLAKWLFSRPQVLILDEPTRGVDVGAKYEIYTIMAELAAQGACIVMISSEMPELLGMCDRIHVMNEGRFVAEFDAAQATQERIMKSIIQSGPQAREAAHVQ
jgi:putative multiple sugar transport system ATP-binding protein